MSQTETRSAGTRLRHSLIKIAVIFGLFGLVILGSAFYLSPQDPLSKADVIVVVSGGQTQARAGRGIELYNQGYAPKIIFSGASLDNGPSNAREMREQALRNGVPDRDIIKDEAARTTYENATNTLLIIHKLEAKRIILVTSPYHQRRTWLTFQKVYGGDYVFINESSFDSRWSKATWWASPFGVFITLSELAKVGYSYATQQYQ